MRLLFIHGIAQQDYTEAQLLAIWTNHLLDYGFDPDKLRAAKPEMAFYGDRLYEWTKGGPVGPVPMGPPMQSGELDFLSKTLDEIAKAKALDEDKIEARASEAAIHEGARAIGQSIWIGRRAVAIVSLLDEISPFLGRFVAKHIRQAYVYLADKNARKDIDDLVRRRLGSGEVVVVSHSLGTVVAFNLLRELSDSGADIKVPLFITLGSPLAIEEVQRWVKGTFAVPKAVTTWKNFYDKGDPVTLGRGLELDPKLKTGFAIGIKDTIVKNDTLNAHSIAGYLDDIVKPLSEAL